jgi:hypothetical protein
VQHLQHGHAGRAGWLAVVLGTFLDPVVGQHVAERRHMMAGLAVVLAQPRQRLLKLGEGHEKAEEARALVFQFCRDRTVYGENRRHSPPVNRNRPQAATQLSILMWVNAKWLTLWQASTIEKQGQEE